MKKIREFLLPAIMFLCGVSVLAGCSTVLGPPDSESEIMESQIHAQHTPQYDLFFEGQPSPAMFTREGGYYLWRTGNVWHVRVAKSDRFRFDTSLTPVFAGEVNVEKGIIVNVAKHHVDIQNDVLQRRDSIVYRFRLRNDVEGFDFSVKPFGIRYCVYFDLKVDQSSDPSIVHLGRSMFVPDRMPLVSCVP